MGRRLAERLDKLMYDYDPYDYTDNEYSVEKAEEDLRNPEFVIEQLINLAEELMEVYK